MLPGYVRVPFATSHSSLPLIALTLAPCSVVFGLHSLFIFLFGGWRVKELISKYHIAPTENRVTLYRITLLLNVACAVLPILKIVVNFIADEVRIYETLSDGYICLAWVHRPSGSFPLRSDRSVRGHRYRPPRA